VSFNLEHSPVSNLPFVNGNRAELPEPLRTWSGTRSPYPREKSVAAVFEEVVAAFPHNVAVVSGNTRLSYTELNSRANQLSAHLQHAGIGPESFVGCCMERSPELIVAFLGILKAGAAYVPLDPTYPKDRLNFLLEDTRCSLVIATQELASTILAGRNLPLLAIGDITPRRSDANNAVSVPWASGQNLAYVMHTSGSTGRPKGVLIENRGIVRLVRNTNYCTFGPDEIFLQFAPISFDASTLEIWGPLLNGGRLVLAPPRAASLDDLGSLIRDYGVTTLWLTAGLFHLMVEQRIEALRPLKQLLAGGDVLNPAHVRTFLEQVPNCTLINGYGPTENTTFTCCHVMRASESIGDTVPIGRPISNTHVFILDEHLQPVPPGVTGELYAAGDGLARGYLNDPEATAAKFVKNPFGDTSADRIYRTGDLARWRTDGAIEFIGRADQQVKILGYRIEPGEIESILGTHHGVKQLHIVPQAANGSKRLVAFYIPSEYPAATPQQLRDFAQEKLPHYMVPAHFVELPAMPLSPNGKVDRSALAQMAVMPKSAEDQPAEQPESQLESRLQELWRRILRVPTVALDENFFDLGGDSLLLVAVHSNLQKQGIKIPVTDLFEFTTVRKLARHIQENQRNLPSLTAIEQQAQKQRDAFSNFRDTRNGGGD
jgi:amino acid adenylation domain-containing protein